MTFLYSDWLKTSLGTRHQIAQIFGISKIKPTHVADNRVVEDGYGILDIESKLNVESMQIFTGSHSKNQSELYKLLVDKIEGREPIVQEEVKTETIVEEPKPEEPKIEEVVEEKPKKVRKTKTK